MKTNLLTFPIILFLGLTFTLAPSVSAQSDLENYTERLLENFEQEIGAVNNFVSEYEKADFEDESSISLFQYKLGSYRNNLNGFLSFYRTATPSDAPKELRDSVDIAITGTEQILRGINSIDSALDNRNNDELQRGQNLLNNGTEQVNNAISNYNAWVDNYNTQADGSAVISSDEIGLGSAFNNTLHYGKPLLYIFVYLLIAGFILSSSFKSKLKNLVAGKIESEKFKGTILYGLHLVILFPYLYALLAFSILLVWDFALVSILIVSSLDRIPIAFIIALFVVVVGSFLAIIKGFFAGKKRNILGTKITNKDQPKIWEACDNIAREIGTKKVDEIYISPQSGIGVYLSGGLFSLLIGKTKRTLTIGMPSISSLSISEMEAILAHEFGHFSNKDTAWNSLTFTMSAALQNTLSTMPNPWNTGDSGWIKFTSALNPALWVLLGYRLLFSVVTSGFSRMREVFADKTAIALYGSSNFTNGLMRVARNDFVFSSYFVPDMLKMLTEEGKMYTNIFQTIDQTYKNIENNKLVDIDKSILAQEKSSMFDSHPLLKDRMEYAKHFEVGQKHKTEMAEFKTLFKNWDEVSKNMSDLYTYYIAVLTGHKFEDSEQKQGDDIKA